MRGSAQLSSPTSDETNELAGQMPPVGLPRVRVSAGGIAAAAVAVAPALIVAIMGYHRRWVSEDAFIDFRVVQHLLMGHGPVFNHGERVEAYTNPLWVALLAIWDALGGSLEYGAVGIGLVLSVAGFLLGQVAAIRLARHMRPAGADQPEVLLPLGSLILVALPPIWDFATSGLETGLIFGWMGCCFYLLVRRLEGAGAGGGWRWTAAAVIMGLGPLIRPDLAIFSAGYLLALAGLGWTRGATRGSIVEAMRLALAAVALPVAYEVFRMGYFAALVPNTALAKEAGAANWRQGLLYLFDFVYPYLLLLPLLPLAAHWVAAGIRLARGRHGRVLILWIVPVLAALAHALYVVRVGGDFMHGRFWIPSLFAGLLPLAVVSLPGVARERGRALIAVAVVAAWAILCASSLRVPYAGEAAVLGTADERGYYANRSGNSNPVTVDDYRQLYWLWQSTALRTGAFPERTLVLDGINRWDEPEGRQPGRDEFYQVQTFAIPKWIPHDITLVAARSNVGVIGYWLGPETWLVDRLGLGDPIAGRLRLNGHGRPGHEKRVRDPWIMARFADPGSVSPLDLSTVSAREALQCGELADLQRAITEPMTLRRFFENVRSSAKFTKLRLPANPAEARAVFCGGAVAAGARSTG